MVGVLRGSCPVMVDIIGVGGSVYDHLQQSGVNVHPVLSNAACVEMDRSRQLKMANLRSWLYWKLREELDPVNNSDLALPPSRELRAELCAVHWRLSSRGVQVEEKDLTKARLGRSPDRGDAVVYTGLEVPGAGFADWDKPLPYSDQGII